MGILLTSLGLVYASPKNQKTKEQVENNPDNREAIKLTQLESYMRADDNQGIANLSLYL